MAGSGPGGIRAHYAAVSASKGLARSNGYNRSANGVAQHMTHDDFLLEQDALIHRMATQSAPTGRWPAGCYGSRLAWLMFVGPSPGGTAVTGPVAPRNPRAEEPLWNQEYTRPCTDWSPGFRASVQPLVETILGRTREQGALKLYGFANFDWASIPRADDVPADRMARGAEVMLNHLSEVGPRVVVTMERRSHELLERELLTRNYVLRRPLRSEITVAINKGATCHRRFDAYEIAGSGLLLGTFVLRSLQHPAKLFNRDYAGRVARALRTVLVGLAERRESIVVSER